MKTKLKELYKQFKDLARKEDTANAIEFFIIVCVLAL